ncbi:type VI secretion system antitoxin TsiV3, partial [Vibrio cholerae]
MNNLLSAYVTILLILLSISGGAIASENCNDTSGVHQKILVCIQNEIAKSETQIRNNISSKSI